MLKITMNGHSGKFQMETDGTMHEIAADTLTIMQELYEMFKKDGSKEIADRYFEIISDNIEYVRDKDALRRKAKKTLVERMKKDDGKDDVKELEEIVDALSSLVSLLKEAKEGQDEE